VSELWGVLGYDRLALDLVEKLAEGPEIRVIAGPPGIGKSWLAKGVGTLWESAGGSVVVAEGDISRSDVSLYPFGIAMDALAGGQEALIQAMAALAKAGELLLGTGGALTGAIEALARLQVSRATKKAILLDPQERDILAKLAKLGRKRPLLVIADNLHWWDSMSLDFLNRLRDPRIADSFPFLAEMRILAVETSSFSQPIAHPKARDRLLLPRLTRTVDLDPLEREGFEEILRALGAPEDLPAETVDLIHNFSGGHLLLAQRCARRLSEGDADKFLSAESPDEFVRELLSERMRVLGQAGGEALGVLQMAAVSGLTFRRDALVCASHIEESEASRLFRYCRKEDLLELNNGTGRFVHDFYRQHFLDSIGEERPDLHQVLGDCMRRLSPADYQARCVNALEAERPEEAAALAVQAALQRQRDGLAWLELPGTILQAIEDGGLTSITEIFQTALDQLKQYRPDECLRSLARMPHGLPTSLTAEATYMRCNCLMITRSERDRRDAEVVLRAWSSYVDEEPELGLRLMRLRLYHLVLQADKEPALHVEAEIRRVLEERQEFDRSACDALYTLDRLAGSTQKISRVLDMNRRAVHYFGSVDEGGVLRRPIEYYLSLLNLGATLIGRESYAEALDVHGDIERLLDSFEPGVFPRTDYAQSNALLAEYRSGLATIEDAVARQREIVVIHGVPGDPFFAENALAVYHAISGGYERSLEIFNQVAKQLKSRGDPEPSLDYLVHANRCVARFFAGMVAPAKQEWEALGEVVAAIPYDTRPEMMRRHKLLADLLSEADTMSAAEFDEALPERDTFCPELRYGFWLPAVEWWR
jgi:hypothetical protein